MNIGSICKRDAVTIDKDCTLHEAAQLMREQHVGALVVTGQNGNSDGAAVLGVVTDRDLAVEVLARGRDGAEVSVAALVTGELAAIPWEASLSDAVAAMESAGVRRLLVTGREQELIGVISIDDVIEAWAADMSRLSRSLRKARENEEQSVPSPLASVLLSIPDDALIPPWQRRG